MIGMYDYKELREKALKTRSFKDCDNLAWWLDDNDPKSWNGESYNIGDGYRMFPIYSEPDEDGNVEYIGWEIR